MDESVDMLGLPLPKRRPGKLKKGKVGNGRRGGNHCCMGACGMCSVRGGSDSVSHLSRKKEVGIFVDCFDTDKGMIMVDVTSSGKMVRHPLYKTYFR